MWILSGNVTIPGVVREEKNRRKRFPQSLTLRPSGHGLRWASSLRGPWRRQTSRIGHNRIRYVQHSQYTHKTPWRFSEGLKGGKNNRYIASKIEMGSKRSEPRSLTGIKGTGKTMSNLSLDLRTRYSCTIRYGLRHLYGNSSLNKRKI